MTERDFDDWLAGTQAGEAARSRSRQRWLQQQAAEDLSLDTVLRACAGGGTVAVSTASGRTHHGRVVVAGIDHCTMRTTSALVHIPLHAITLVRAAHGAHPDSGRAHADRRLTDVLADVVASGRDVRVGLRDRAELLAGELVGVGDELIVIRPHEAEQVLYVTLCSLAELSLPWAADFASG